MKKQSNPTKKIKKTDKVVVISGKDKGKSGVILSLSTKTNMITIENVNVRKVHKKAKKQGEESGIYATTKPIHISKVMVVDPTSLDKKGRTKKEVRASKVKLKRIKDSKTKKTKVVRILKKSNIEI